ncbi:DUF4380 domain-containing protein [bacterium]|nr:DUF4380 domain-containing protein [bacterium]
MALDAKLVKNYKNWGWQTWVLKNEWVSLAVVPAIGGRIMEYALGKHSPVFINPALLGKTVAPEPEQDWPNFGGYKVWPAPQASWNWPPPPVLDHGAYQAELTQETDEAVTLTLKSPIEKWQAPGLALERSVTLKHNSTRAFIRETLINAGEEDISWSIWDVTQQTVTHPGREDFTNFHAYFPVRSRSRYGETGVYHTGESAAWKGEAAPGIFKVEYCPDGQKIFGDSHEGWIGYADAGLDLVMTKSFPNFHGKPYPDNEARVAVYVSERELPYMEVEVMGPIVELAPGESTSLSLDWGIARAEAPVLDVNDIGVVTQGLATGDQKLTGKYGVFNKGSIYMVYRDLRGVMLKKTVPQPVSPLKPVSIDEPARIDAEVRLIEVQVNGQDGHTLGVIDSLEILPEK